MSINVDTVVSNMNMNMFDVRETPSALTKTLSNHRRNINGNEAYRAVAGIYCCPSKAKLRDTLKDRNTKESLKSRFSALSFKDFTFSYTFPYDTKRSRPFAK